FDDDEAHLTAVNQSSVQDILWVHREAKLIAATQFPAYFVTPNTEAISDAHVLHLVVPLTKNWRDLHDAAWRRLAKDDLLLSVKIYDVPSGHPHPAQWAGRIMEWPNSIPGLKEHPTKGHELVVRLRVKSDPQVTVHHFADRQTAEEALAQGIQN
ncbi:hypothetical protein IL306_007411, partial [Fusarium sp. DS 682]